MRNPENRMDARGPGRRCAECRLAAGLCLCALVPRLETRTRVVLVMHSLEERKTTNTGRLAMRCLPNSAVVLRGDPRGVVETPRWDEHGEPLLLFPGPDAVPLETFAGPRARPLTLIVPDGTWGQAQRARRRVPGLATVPCVSIKRDQPSTYRLRTTPVPGRLSTIEAIAEALGILEGKSVRAGLLAIFDEMVTRTLRARAGDDGLGGPHQAGFEARAAALRPPA